MLGSGNEKKKKRERSGKQEWEKRRKGKENVGKSGSGVNFHTFPPRVWSVMLPPDWGSSSHGRGDDPIGVGNLGGSYA